MMKIYFAVFFYTLLMPACLSLFTNRCGKYGTCKYFDDCLTVLNKIKLNATAPTKYCDEAHRIVCCEDLKNARLSERKCLEYMDFVFEKTPVEKNKANSEVRKVSRCATENTEPFGIRIVGGESADTNEYPHMAAIGAGEEFNPNLFFCGGSLISEKYILTAAHCLEDYDNAEDFPTMVRLGALNITTPDNYTVDVRATRFIMHPDYKKGGDYDDIGLIELEKPVKFNPFLRPACLPGQNDVQLPTVLTATGWGTTKFEGDTSKTLMEVILPYVDQAMCQSKIGNIVTNGIKDTQLCYGGVSGEDTCQGDSGGPLSSSNKHVYCSYTIFGITSFGDKCGLVKPAVYTKVSKYLDWIQGIVWPGEE